MTIRRALHAMLSGEGTGDDAGAPSASTVRDALDRAGFGDVPTELAGTAIGHYADSAELAHADAVAPLATEASGIPFDDVLDAPDGDDGAHDVDPMDALDAATDAATDADADADADADGVGDVDPDDVDPDAEPDVEPGESTDASMVDDDSDDPIEFGTGSNEAPAPDEVVDPFEGLDDGSAEGLGFSLDEPASFSDAHGAHDVDSDGDATASLPEYDGADLEDLDDPDHPDDRFDGFDDG